jgi:3-methylcrotonyl-CoA carboxylase alpha subunit
LSENDTFASACAAQGVVFIGPPASAIAAMGSKSAAKTIMSQAKVPLVPGYHGDNQDAAFLHEQARAMGYPVLIKASAGGGGKGMRIVSSDDAFIESLASCRREAKASFDNDQVLIERYLTKPRHIEVQVFADTHGNCLYLFERDCSVQRRHQKVVEEAPAPGMTPARRKQMGEAAVAAAKAVGYVGAGTVEFIAEPSGEFYFMEMNTRLQVEHPVTEAITQLDLVEWQLLAAAGRPLPLKQSELQISGHAIEARIYAENTAKQFLPTIGPIHHLRTPSCARFTNANVRVDSGIVQGGEISPYYDPMIAKLIVWGETREIAISRMKEALQQFEVAPLITNVGFLQKLMRSDSFVNADLDTGLIERERAVLFDTTIEDTTSILAKAITAQLAVESTHASNNSSDPWSSTTGWRLHGFATRVMSLVLNDANYQATVQYSTNGVSIAIDDAKQSVQLTEVSYADSQLRGTFHHNDHTSFPFSNSVVQQGSDWIVFQAGVPYLVRLKPALDFALSSSTHVGAVTAPMPGKIVALLVTAGTKVKTGQALLVMEAMKMEHTITAPRDTTVKAFVYAVGDQVSEGANLIDFADSENVNP